MKTAKTGNLSKLVAFFLIAIVLITAIAFSASGWEQTDEEPDSDNVNGDQTANNDKDDENKDGPSESEDENVVAPTPYFTHFITGLEITEAESFIKPICFVSDPTAPCYGISSSLLTIEIPIEDGKTRFLIYTDDATSIGKLGTITNTRGYINYFASYFGSILMSSGNDDMFKSESNNDGLEHIDFSKVLGYHYTEFEKYNYTNADLIKAYLKNNGINTVMKNDAHPVPYIFNNERKKVGDSTANKVLLHFNNSNSTELVYSEATGKYTLTKNASVIKDLINDNELSYDNVFVLFADATTYETQAGTQTVLDTNTSGAGYYVSEGTRCDITWRADSEGELHFYNSDGDILSINRGISYIGFLKASQTGSVEF